MNRTKIAINPYKLIQTFFCSDIEKYIYFFKIRQIIGKNLNNPKGASFKENRLMTTARDALGTTSIFRFSTQLFKPIKTRIK